MPSPNETLFTKQLKSLAKNFARHESQLLLNLSKTYLVTLT
ncbi:hypothetical protein VCRA2123O443_40205 [Vibrio crassostreae]|nr:hypothetical protein VCRA211O406_30203 [Vibrio crassostreae]CAK3409494.1 hypothetical protein VCRA2123O443_40205 [Vibrio crassostreae]